MATGKEAVGHTAPAVRKQKMTGSGPRLQNLKAHTQWPTSSSQTPLLNDPICVPISTGSWGPSGGHVIFKPAHTCMSLRKGVERCFSWAASSHPWSTEISHFCWAWQQAPSPAGAILPALILSFLRRQGQGHNAIYRLEVQLNIRALA